MYICHIAQYSYALLLMYRTFGKLYIALLHAICTFHHVTTELNIYTCVYYIHTSQEYFSSTNVVCCSFTSSLKKFLVLFD